MKSSLLQNRNIGVGVCTAIAMSLCSSARAQVTCFGIADTNPAVCSGHGTCVAQDTCICDAGYTGFECEIPPTCFGVAGNDPSVCSGHGTCIGPDTCDCQVGFIGGECEFMALPTVTVGNPGNAGEESGDCVPNGGGPCRECGAVDHVYNIGTFEVTAGQYRDFLNAVDPGGSNPYGLYSGAMDSDSFGCQITWNAGSSTYDFSGRPSGTEADWVDRPVNYVSWGDAARFCNWMHNGQGSGDTETGSYELNGAMSNAELMAITRDPGATWVIPSEDEWYKSAYHYNDGVTGNYYDYPTSSDTMPRYVNDNGNLSGSGETFIEGETDPGNYATHNADHGTDGIGAPYYRTEVGEWENSDSPCGTSDQGGNVWEWSEAVVPGPYRLLRGASLSNNGLYKMLAAGRWSNHPSTPTYEYYAVGFRVADVSSECGNGVVEFGEECDDGNEDDTDFCLSTCEVNRSIPAVSEWGIVAMTLLVLTAGTVVLVRRRISRVAAD